MTPHADLVARLEELASKNGCLSAAYENCIEQGASQSDMCLTCAAATAAKALAALPPPANPLYEYCPSCRRLGPLFGLTAIRSEETGGRHCISCFGKTESRLLPLWTAPPPADPPAIVALGERLRTQDNQMTAHPIFVVEHRNDARRPWEFVTACLTDEGARAYMNANGHNLRKFSRIFVHSGYRNDQWIGLRNHLMALPAAPPVTDTPQGVDDSRCAVCGWPLDPEGKMCSRGDCSLRPLPEMARDAARAVREYEAEWKGAINSPTLERWRAQAAKQSATPEPAPEAMPPIEVGDVVALVNGNAEAVLTQSHADYWNDRRPELLRAERITAIYRTPLWTREPRR